MMIGFLGLQKTYDIMKNSVKSAKTRRVGSQNKNIIRAQKDYSPEAILHKLGNGVKSALEMVGKSLQKTLNKNADFTRVQKDCRAIILNALKNGVKVALNLFDDAADKDKRFLSLQKTRDVLKNSVKPAPELLSVLNANRLTIERNPRRILLAMCARMPLKNICEIKDDNFKR